MEDTRDLHLLGVSFRTAPISVREALSFNRPQAVALLQGAAAAIPGLEALVLSTCNRTEFYLIAQPGSKMAASWLDYLRQCRPQAPIIRPDCQRYELSGTAAVRHMFRVACGLDSAILGDMQILSQVKNAQAIAAESRTLGDTLHRVCNQAVHAGKRARHETAIGQGAASIGSALALMLAEWCRKQAAVSNPSILVIGAGEAARNISQHVAKRRLGFLTLINRTESKASALAQACGGRARLWSALPLALVCADVVVAATAAAQPILRRDMLDEVVRHRPHRPLLVIDAGVPRNVEPIPSIDVIDIDAIQERQEDGLELRRSAISAVERIVEDEALVWERWCASRPIERTIKTLYQDVACLSREVATRLVNQDILTPTHAEHLILRSFKQLLHDHVRRLRNLPMVKEVPLTPLLGGRDRPGTM